ncbi:MAG: hypothetical protein FWG64_03460 [Firmicutes bacterium]|nr:hypothetical protein [Bacillota bacterium]
MSLTLSLCCRNIETQKRATEDGRPYNFNQCNFSTLIRILCQLNIPKLAKNV